jgi:hypothetical protein
MFKTLFNRIYKNKMGWDLEPSEAENMKATFA